MRIILRGFQLLGNYDYNSYILVEITVFVNLVKRFPIIMPAKILATPT